MVGVEEVGGGCTLCGSPDFLRGAFGERTMLLCDQCEREFHVGCLRSSGRCELDVIPEGDPVVVKRDAAAYTLLYSISLSMLPLFELMAHLCAVALTAGDWFCSASCSGIHAMLRNHVKAGVQPLAGDHGWQIMRVR